MMMVKLHFNDKMTLMILVGSLMNVVVDLVYWINVAISTVMRND